MTAIGCRCDLPICSHTPLNTYLVTMCIHNVYTYQGVFSSFSQYLPFYKDVFSQWCPQTPLNTSLWGRVVSPLGLHKLLVIPVLGALCILLLITAVGRQCMLPIVFTHSHQYRPLNQGYSLNDIHTLLSIYAIEAQCILSMK